MSESTSSSTISDNAADDPASATPTTALQLHQNNDAAWRAIEVQVQQQPLTSERRPLTCLEEQYASENSNTNFRQGLTALQQDYTHVRTVRGDGNCFFRAVLYALTEQQQPSHNNNKTESERLWQYVQDQSWQDVRAAGYDETALEIFYEAAVDLFQRASTTGVDTAAWHHQEMNVDHGPSDYCTWYLRVVTAAYLKRDPERFLPFVLQQSAAETEFLDIDQFCARFVEPMGQECEQVQVLALAEALGVRVHIEYLDGRELLNNNSGKLSNHQFGPEDSATLITLLYRPGHYDILYKK